MAPSATDADLVRNAPLHQEIETPKMTKITVLTGPQGGGKSEVMRKEAIASPGLYLFALPTQALLDEQYDDFFKSALLLRRFKVSSAQPRSGRTVELLTSTRKEIEKLGLSHAVVFTTHDTLMAHDLNGFDDWHIRIDEAPGSVKVGKVNITSLRPWLREHFGLHGREDIKWAAVSPLCQLPSWKEVQKDRALKPLADFIKQAGQPERVFVSTSNWDVTDEVTWFSLWTPLSLNHCASVQIAGSSYTRSIGFLAVEALFKEEFEVTIREIAPLRTAQPSITIHYFTQAHEGTSYFWQEDTQGRKMIKRVCDHLGGVLSETAYWSGNWIVEILMDHRLRADFIRPLCTGTNKKREATACAFIYSAKPKPSDSPLMEVFELSREQIVRALEGEAIAQFVMRGAIRNRDFGGEYPIYVYSRQQAEWLRDYLGEIGFTTVDVIPVDEAGIMDEVRVTSAPKPLSAEEKAAKEERAKLRDRDRQRAARAKAAEAAGRTAGVSGRPRSPISVKPKPQADLLD